MVRGCIQHAFSCCPSSSSVHLFMQSIWRTFYNPRGGKMARCSSWFNYVAGHSVVQLQLWRLLFCQPSAVAINYMSINPQIQYQYKFLHQSTINSYFSPSSGPVSGQDSDKPFYWYYVPRPFWIFLLLLHGASVVVVYRGFDDGSPLSYRKEVLLDQTTDAVTVL